MAALLNNSGKAYHRSQRIGCRLKSSASKLFAWLPSRLAMLLLGILFLELNYFASLKCAMQTESDFHPIATVCAYPSRSHSSAQTDCIASG